MYMHWGYVELVEEADLIQHIVNILSRVTRHDYKNTVVLYSSDPTGRLFDVFPLLLRQLMTRLLTEDSACVLPGAAGSVMVHAMLQIPAQSSSTLLSLAVISRPGDHLKAPFAVQ